MVVVQSMVVGQRIVVVYSKLVQYGCGVNNGYGADDYCRLGSCKGWSSFVCGTMVLVQVQ